MVHLHTSYENIENIEMREKKLSETHFFWDEGKHILRNGLLE